jgi:hypothetical protein
MFGIRKSSAGTGRNASGARGAPTICNCTFGGSGNKVRYATARTVFCAIDLNIPGLR